MAEREFYRGGGSLIPNLNEVRIDRVSGLVTPRRGVSIRSRKEGLERFGGAYRVTQLPADLQIIQSGRDPDHYEIIPKEPMMFERYESLLQKVVLVPIED